MTNSAQNLKKSMTRLDTVMLCIGAIIGSGAFLLPGDLFLKNIGVLNTLIGMLLGVLFVIVIEKSYAFFLRKESSAGGEFFFTYKAIGKQHAFICGWFLVLAYICLVPFNILGLIKVSRILFPGVLDQGYLYTIAGYDVFLLEIVVSTCILAFFTFSNIKGLNLAAKLQRYMSLILVLIVFSTGLLFALSPQFNQDFFIEHFQLDSISMLSVLKVLSIAPFAFIGFDCVTQVAEELDYEAKQASKMVFWALIAGFLMYNMLNIMTATVYNAQMLQQDNVSWATGMAAQVLYGPIGKYAVAVALLMAITAGINGFFIAASRLLFAMARKNALPKWFESINKNGIPHKAILFILLVSLPAPWLGNGVLGWMIDMTSVGATTGYLYTCISAYRMSKRENNRSQIIFSILGIIVSCIFMALLLLPSSSQISTPAYYAIVIWSVIGVGFYLKNRASYIPSSLQKSNHC